MAFMGIMLVTLLVAVMAIGALLVLVGIIILIVRAIRNRSRKQPSRASLVVGIVFVVLGSLSFVPMAGLMLLSELSEEPEEIPYQEIKNPVTVDEYTWEAGFTFEGVELVPATELTFTNDAVAGEAVGTIVFDSSTDFYSIQKLQSTSGYDIYLVGYLVMVPRADYDKIMDYYHNEASLNASFEWLTSSNADTTSCECEFDRQMFLAIQTLSNGEGEFVVKEESEITERYCFTLASDDGIFWQEIILASYDGGVMLGGMTDRDLRSGWVLSDEQADYVTERFEACSNQLAGEQSSTQTESGW